MHHFGPEISMVLIFRGVHPIARHIPKRNWHNLGFSKAQDRTSRLKTQHFLRQVNA
jgi:hypothetical protein